MLQCRKYSLAVPTCAALDTPDLLAGMQELADFILDLLHRKLKLRLFWLCVVSHASQQCVFPPDTLAYYRPNAAERSAVELARPC